MLVLRGVLLPEEFQPVALRQMIDSIADTTEIFKRYASFAPVVDINERIPYMGVFGQVEFNKATRYDLALFEIIGAV